MVPEVEAMTWRLFLVIAAVWTTLPIPPLTLTAYAQPSVQGRITPEAVQLYKDVMSGKRSIQSLTPDEKASVSAVYRLMRRSSRTTSQKAECRDALDRAESAAGDVASYGRRLISCVECGDHRDDCSSEFRRVHNAHSDYESAVSEVGSYCD
jgi:hypothetical protein